MMICLFSWMGSFSASCQRQVVFHVTVKEGISKPDSIFLAGNFNGWKPNDPAYALTANDSGYSLKIADLKEDNIAFKFTRGSWETVETGAKGKDIPNRNFQLQHDTVISVTIKGWADAFARFERKHTRSKNVKIEDTAFAMPQLNSTVRIWIYLPPGYSKSTARYPVIYAQDGQNLFDNYTAPFGEWGLDESLDSLSKNLGINYIVVGIDSGPERLREYNPYDNDKYGSGLGEQYVSFLIETLKPYIDEHYRTRPDPQHSIIMGSSMGGLISYYAALTHPEVFGKAGVFSPSFWIAPEMVPLTDSLSVGLRTRFFFYAGKKEGEDMVKDMENISDRLARNAKSLAYMVVDENGSHNETAWKKWFPEFIRWINSNGYEYRLSVP